uniref:Putative nitrophorin 4b n=1 Tax=Panstrongylus lignarius TaxID=156445 RepID=A0A224XZ61_9HEMI
MLTLSLLLLLTTSIASVSSGFGKCPTKSETAIPIWPSFIRDWYDYASYGDLTNSIFRKCIKYSFTSTQNTVHAKREFSVKLFNTQGSSHYTIASGGIENFNMIGEEFLTWTINNVWLIDADYDKYLILWSCDEHLFGTFSKESSWILTRNRTEILNKDIETKIKNVLEKHNMDLSWYSPVSQSGC